MKKLSWAIRTGAKLRPKCTGLFFNDKSGLPAPFSGEHGEVGSCSLGAAYEALLDRPFDPAKEYPVVGDVFQVISYRTNVDFDMLVEMPGMPGHLDKLWSVIVLLNDPMDWTREAVADWLEGLGL